jgi:hypothetical protein
VEVTFLRGGRIVKIHDVFPAGHSALAPDFLTR